MESIAELRHLLLKPDIKNWEALCLFLEELEDPIELEEVVLPYVIEHTADWPVSLCKAPEEWIEELEDGHYSPRWRIIQCLELAYVTWSPKQLSWVGEQDTWENLSRLSFLDEPRFGGKKGWKLLAESPLMAHLTEFACREFHLKAEFLEALCACPSLPNWRTLTLKQVRIDDDKAQILADGLYQGKLETLDLSANKLTGPGVRVLSQAKGLEHLQFLALGNQDVRHDSAVYNRIGTEGVEAIANSDLAQGLVSLDIAYNQLEDITLQKLSKGAFSSLKRLELQSNYFTEEGLTSLAQSPWFESLTSLDISGHRLGAKRAKAFFEKVDLSGLREFSCGRMHLGLSGVKALASNCSFENLELLSIEGNALKIKGCKALFEGGRFSSLRSLNLSNNDLGDEGMQKACELGQFTGLEHLLCDRNGIGLDGCKAICELSHLDKLRHLSLNKNKLEDEALQEIAKSERFSALELLGVDDNNILDGELLKSLFDSPHFPELETIYWFYAALRKPDEIES